MATTKKVAITKNQKAAPAKKAVVKQAAPAKKATATPTAKTAAAPPKKAAVKTAATKAAARPVGVTQKVVAGKPAVSKAVPPDKSVAKKKAPTVAPVEQPVKKVTVSAKSTTQKVTDTKVATPRVVAEKEKQISKPVEKEEIMPVKNNKEDKEKVVAKDASKKPAVQKTEKAPVKADKPAERSADKKGSKATTLVTYQPEFTKSVLDQPEAPSGPIYRYSDVDLLEFKELIQKKLEAAKKELVYLQGLITRKDEAGTDDTENKYMSMEDGSGSQEREQLNQMASRQIQFIDHLEKAMIRIENKTYGICRVTGKLIDKARLRAVPHATLSIEAKLAKSK
jgi:RNA polymerase-binding transcription factor DksA